MYMYVFIYIFFFFLIMSVLIYLNVKKINSSPSKCFLRYPLEKLILTIQILNNYYKQIILKQFLLFSEYLSSLDDKIIA